eukprot:13395133-Alexandrium_andersonii.AAC.1
MHTWTQRSEDLNATLCQLRLRLELATPTAGEATAGIEASMLQCFCRRDPIKDVMMARAPNTDRNMT